MKKAMLIGLLAGVILTMRGVAEESAPPVGLAAMTGFDHLWIYSDQVKAGMYSSTDLKGGNLDMIHGQGKYRGEKILAQVSGPGCVYRIWTALAMGTLKVYLDGSKKPEIVCGFKDYTTGKCPGLPGEFIAGHANYLPIPFEKSIIVTAIGFDFPAYYQVSYMTYDPSVKVTSFKKSTALTDPLLPAARAFWSQNPLDLSEAGLLRAEASGIGSEVALNLKGAGVIRKLIVKNPANPADPLAGLKLTIRWDGQKEHAVGVPLEAFFINSPDLKEKWPGGSLKNFFIAAGKDGYVAAFPMPFSSAANISVSALGADRKVQIIALYEKRDSLPANAMRFHAFYRSQDYETNVTKENTIRFWSPINPETNYRVLEETGKGNYLGAALFTKSVGTLWWGEGDEMDWIDNAAKPQIQGTGTEDEFNWGWGYKPEFAPVSGTLPVVPACKETIAAQIIPRLRNPACEKTLGDNIAYRFRLTDYLPFSSAIKTSYEVLGTSWVSPHWIFTFEVSQTRGDDYSSVAYWYELP